MGEAPAAAEVGWWRSWRGDRACVRGILAEAPPPCDPARAMVVMARDEELDLAAWNAVPRRSASLIAGDHEAAGAFAAAAAVAAIAGGVVDEALLIGIAPDRGHALLFRAPPQGPQSDAESTGA
jgi:3-oxoacyl-[acyl-carrier-protein] synthase II